MRRIEGQNRTGRERSIYKILKMELRVQKYETMMMAVRLDLDTYVYYVQTLYFLL